MRFDRNEISKPKHLNTRFNNTYKRSELYHKKGYKNLRFKKKKKKIQENGYQFKKYKLYRFMHFMKI